MALLDTSICVISSQADFTLGKARGLQVTQLFPEEGNLGLVLPTHLCKWTTGKVRQEGVNVLPGTSVSKVTLSEDNKVKTTLTDGSEVSEGYVVHVLLKV